MVFKIRDASNSRHDRGFTFLELAVVITIISVLAVFALDRYYRLLVDVERTAMTHDLGVMRSAISLQVAGHFVAGDMAGLEGLVNSNPMELLAEKPDNYLGVIHHERLEGLAPGNWFFEASTGTLLYMVRNDLYFETSLGKPKRARFMIQAVSSEKLQGGAKQTYLSGLKLQALEPYRWLRPWD